MRRSTIPDEQGLSELLLEVEHCLAHCRLGLPEGPPGPRKTAFFRDRHECQQTVRVERYLHY